MKKNVPLFKDIPRSIVNVQLEGSSAIYRHGRFSLFINYSGTKGVEN